MSTNWESLLNVSCTLYKDLRKQHMDNINAEVINMRKWLETPINWKYYKRLQKKEQLEHIYKKHGECYITVIPLSYVKIAECRVIAEKYNIIVGPNYNCEDGHHRYSFIWKVDEIPELEEVDYLI